MSYVDIIADMESEENTNVGKRPMEERWPPLGAPSNEISQETETSRSDSQLKQLEDEHEKLNSSLSALTTHFAQVQFRLKQVVAAPKSDQEGLLQSLEKFAFEGIPDVDGAKPSVKRKGKMAFRGYEKKLSEQKKKQEKLITQLKEQLQQMEEAVVKGASHSADSTEKLIEKQKLLLAQLSLQDKKARTSAEEKDELLNDQIPKEQVIRQITKQIIDLEKFIKLLQGETGLSPKKCRKCSSCSCEHEHEHEQTSRPPTAKNKKKKANLHSALQKSPLLNARKTQPRATVDREEEHWKEGLGVNYTVDNFGIIDDNDSGQDVACCILPKHGGPGEQVGPEETPGESNQRIKEASLEIIKRALAILQIFAMSQFGCAGQHLQDQLYQKAMQTPVPPYENLTRYLRKSVENVLIQQAKVLEELGVHSPGLNPATLSRTSRSGSMSSLVSTVSSIADGSGEFTTTEAELIRTIRREFSTCLRDLFEHGLEKNVDYRLISAKSLTNCIMPGTSPQRGQNMHAWDIFMTYYRIKHGREYNSAVPRMLSESFGIDVSGACAVTSKQTLLRTIHFVKSTHERCKRSKESMFRALVCAGLNQKKLSLWCRQIVKCGSLVDENYQTWSCVVATGFEDVLDILERLTPLDFCLPEDLAIRHLTRANEAFGENY